MLREKVPPTREKKRKKVTPALARLVPLGGGPPFSMTKGTITIGRDLDCDLVLPEEDTSISRHHAKISLVDEKFFLEDSSTHGTFVDGERVSTKTQLEDGVEIRLGLHGTRFTFQVLRGKTPLRSAERAATLTEGPRDEGPSKSGEETVAGSTLARLVPVEKGPSFSVKKEVITIGRDPDCDLVLPEEDTSISGQHARITLLDGQFILEDLDSASDTFVNGQQVSKKWQLVDGAEIQFGLHEAKFTFHVGDKA
jgi:pSer/pThr/pTyr-binding forkhead associated (FHA) protein